MVRRSVFPAMVMVIALAALTGRADAAGNPWRTPDSSFDPPAGPSPGRGGNAFAPTDGDSELFAPEREAPVRPASPYPPPNYAPEGMPQRPFNGSPYPTYPAPGSGYGQAPGVWPGPGLGYGSGLWPTPAPGLGYGPGPGLGYGTGVWPYGPVSPPYGGPGLWP